MLKTKLGSIKKELAACRKAWSENSFAKFAWCCHHSILVEPLKEPAENRIQYILSGKPENEQAIRLHNFRPVRVELPADYNKAGAEYKKAYDEWNKARVEYIEAYAGHEKACAGYNKACAGYNKAYAEYNKACAGHEKACEKYDKACAECDKARADCKEELTALHNQDWPDNSWNGKDIF